MDCGQFWSRCAWAAREHEQPEILMPAETVERQLRPLGRRSNPDVLCPVNFVGGNERVPDTTEELPIHVLPRLRHMNSTLVSQISSVEHLKPDIDNPSTPPRSITRRRRRTRSDRTSIVTSREGSVSSWRIPPTAVMSAVGAEEIPSSTLVETTKRLTEYSHRPFKTAEESRLPDIPIIPLRKPDNMILCERTHLKSALKKNDASDTLKPSQVVLTGPVALCNEDSVGIASPPNRLPKSFWDGKNTDNESEGGDAVFVGPGERGRSSVLLVTKPEPPVRPPARESESSAHHYTPTGMAATGGPLIFTTAEVFTVPTVNLTQQHPFSVPRRRSSIKEEVEKVDISDLERESRIHESPFYRAHLAGSTSTLTDIIQVAGDQMRADGAELQYIPSAPDNDILISYRIHIDKDCEKMVLRKATETAGWVLPIKDIIQTYTWIEVLKNSRLHSRLADSVFQTLTQHQLRSLLVIQYRQGMFIKCDWFVAECPTHALSIHMLCSAVYGSL